MVEEEAAPDTRGLWDDLHGKLSAELARRGNGLSVTSGPTRVLSIGFEGAPAGVTMQYRAHASIAEIAIGRRYKGSRVLLHRLAEPDFVVVSSGGEHFVRLPDWKQSGLQEAPDIADALEKLRMWWSTRGHLATA